MNDVTTKAGVIAELESCWSAAGVANLLCRLGVKGVPHKPDHCPLANLLRPVYGTRVEVCNDSPDAEDDRAAWVVVDGRVDDHRFEAPGVCDFIDAFDNGAYPDLIERR
jgi:hypothetical protein